MNELLQLLTNRRAGNVWSELNSLFRFQPKRCAGHVEELRAFLGLQQPSGSDYCVMSALNTVAGIAAYHELFDSAVSYDLASYTPPKDKVLNAKLMPDRHGPPFVHRQPQEWPACQNILVDYYNTGLVKLSLAGKSPERVKFHELDGSLHVDWPESYGVRGALELEIAWVADSQIEIVHTPVGLPYTVLLEALRKQTPAERVMRESGFMDAYIGAQSDAERMAAVYAGLAVLTRNS